MRKISSEEWIAALEDLYAREKMLEAKKKNVKLAGIGGEGSPEFESWLRKTTVEKLVLFITKLEQA